MKLIEILVLGLAIGLPGVALQLHLYRRDQKRKSVLWSTWSELQTELVRVLHKPHAKDQPLDRLLEKLETFTMAGVSTISDDDRIKLTIMLRQKMDDPNQTREDRARAEFMLLAMPRAHDERKRESRK